jgi:hypothetical protein
MDDFIIQSHFGCFTVYFSYLKFWIGIELLNTSPTHRTLVPSGGWGSKGDCGLKFGPFDFAPQTDWQNVSRTDTSRLVKIIYSKKLTICAVIKSTVPVALT